MDFEGALLARLKAAAPVVALVDQRVSWEERPQGSALPAITLEFGFDNRPQHFSGFQSVRDARIQVNCWGRTFAEKKAIKEAVIAALTPEVAENGIAFQQGVSIGAFPANERVETQMIYREVVEMVFHYSAV